MVTTLTMDGYHTDNGWLPHWQKMVTTLTMDGYPTDNRWLPHWQWMVTTLTMDVTTLTMDFTSLTMDGYHTDNGCYLTDTGKLPHWQWMVTTLIHWQWLVQCTVLHLGLGFCFTFRFLTLYWGRKIVFWLSVHWVFKNAFYTLQMLFIQLSDK